MVLTMVMSIYTYCICIYKKIETKKKGVLCFCKFEKEEKEKWEGVGLS